MLRLLKIMIVAFALGALMAFTYAFSPRARSILSWTYVTRYLTYPLKRPVTSVDWYQPVEKVEGGDGPMLRRIRKTDPLGASVRDKLTQYAKATDTEALLVVRAAAPRRGLDLDPELIFEYVDPSASKDALPGHRLLTDGNSMAKTPLGLLLGIALSQGKIASLDEKAATYLPEWREDGRKDITIRQLLTMSSGLRNWDSKRFPLSDLAVMHLGTQLEDFALSIPAVESPGNRYEYNNVNSQVLGIILERAYHRRYASLLSELLWKPIAAQDAYLWLDHEGGQARTYCCLMASAYDWARVGLLLLKGGQAEGKQVVPRDWVAQMIKPGPLSPQFGMHLFHATPDKGYAGPGTYYLSGLGQQHVWVIPEQKIVIVRVGEKHEPWNFEEAYLPNLVWQTLPHG
jgi:CubicO group peptidase (beta-lactamase class C family)